MTRLAPALLLLLAACGGGDAADVRPGGLVDTNETDADTDADTDSDTDTDTDADSDSDTDTDTELAFTVDVLWSGSSPGSNVEVIVNDPDGRTDWRFGMAETEAGGAGWYGEDCYLGTGAWTYCHDFGGTSLELDQVSSIAEIVEGSTTLLWSGMNLTYYLEDAVGGDCWVWGHDPSYYASFGCTELGTGTIDWGRRGGCSGMDPADPAPLNGKIALTFDDGPSLTVTPQVLDVLREHNVPATFFMLGENVADPAVWPLVEEIVADPLFDVANHSWDHADLALLSEVDFRDEVEDTNALLSTFLGSDPTFFRFPYGDSTCFTADAIRDDYGQIPVGWHIDTADWCYASGGTCSEAEYWRIPAGFEGDMLGWVVDQARAFDGGVILMHDIHQYTADNLEDVILELKAEGFTFTSVDDATTFPLLNADTPFDFPWVGEGCDTSNDTCWQVEWSSWCEPTNDPGQPATAGVCVLPCDGSSECIDRDGTAPLTCADTSQGGFCLAQSESINGYCADVAGSVEESLPGFPSGAADDVCVPYAW